MGFGWWGYGGDSSRWPAKCHFRASIHLAPWAKPARSHHSQCLGMLGGVACFLHLGCSKGSSCGSTPVGEASWFQILEWKSIYNLLWVRDKDGSSVHPRGILCSAPHHAIHHVKYHIFPISLFVYQSIQMWLSQHITSTVEKMFGRYLIHYTLSFVNLQSPFV